MARLQPRLNRLKSEFGQHPQHYAEKLRKLHAEEGLSFLDARSLFGLIAQAPIL